MYERKYDLTVVTALCEFHLVYAIRKNKKTHTNAKLINNNVVLSPSFEAFDTVASSVVQQGYCVRVVPKLRYPPQPHFISISLFTVEQ